MLRETLQALDLKPGLIVVDGTVGAAGHSLPISKAIRPGGLLIGLDRDQEMLARAAQTLTGQPHQPGSAFRPAEDIVLEHSSYCDLPAVLERLQVPKVDRILVDLGLSSDQLESSERGFGFQTSGDLDMRFDRTRGAAAKDWLAQATVAEITNVLVEFGEEPHSAELAPLLSQMARSGKLETAANLADAVLSVYGGRGAMQRGSHPATRTFQAIRIHVNSELTHLQRFLTTVAPECLKPGGLLAVISFHSVEDRMVKQAFQDTATWQSASAKPIAPSALECKVNPRCRSAKLRSAIRA